MPTRLWNASQRNYRQNMRSIPFLALGTVIGLMAAFTGVILLVRGSFGHGSFLLASGALLLIACVRHLIGLALATAA